jgi:hypothetical protein
MINFRFDTNYECLITIYLAAYEVTNVHPHPILYFTLAFLNHFHYSFVSGDQERNSNIYKFSKGYKQSFPKNAEIVNTLIYETSALCKYDEDIGYYPLVIRLVFNFLF